MDKIFDNSSFLFSSLILKNKLLFLILNFEYDILFFLKDNLRPLEKVSKFSDITDSVSTSINKYDPPCKSNPKTIWSDGIKVGNFFKVSLDKKFGSENSIAKKLNRITKYNCHFLNCTINLKLLFYLSLALDELLITLVIVGFAITILTLFDIWASILFSSITRETLQ